MTDRLRCSFVGHDWYPGTCGHSTAWLCCRRCGRYKRTTTADWHRRFDVTEEADCG